jgi:hypothetical protein
VKTCFKCHRSLSLDEFYRHPMMADGHLGKCKECTKLDMRRDRVTKPRVREYDRDRANLPHRVALRKRISEAWSERHPEKRAAQHKANNAVRDGHLDRQLLCEGCGLDRKLSKHHHDYSKPLVVVWLCKPCHAIADKLRRRLETA